MFYQDGDRLTAIFFCGRQSVFPLIVLIGYFKTYYFSAFFDVPSVANALVHAHGIVMTVWVLYFVAQVALIRSKNIKLHMTIGICRHRAGGNCRYCRNGDGL